MKLHSVDGQVNVPDGHDHLAVGAGDDLKFRRHGLRENRQGVIPSRDERIRKALEHPGIGVENRTGLAMQEFRSTVNSGAERRADRLVPETNTQ